MRVKELMAAADISRDTLRFYEKEALITRPPRDRNGYRNYSEYVLEEIRFIRIAQSVGFPLKEIKRAIPYLGNPNPGCPLLKAALEKQLAAVEAKIMELTAAKVRLHRWLDKNAAQARSHPTELRHNSLDAKQENRYAAHENV